MKERKQAVIDSTINLEPKLLEMLLPNKMRN